MTESPSQNINLNLTDEEFVRLHAAASSDGLEVNEFIVATLRKHGRIMGEIAGQQDENESETPSALI